MLPNLRNFFFYKFNVSEISASTRIIRYSLSILIYLGDIFLANIGDFIFARKSRNLNEFESYIKVFSNDLFKYIKENIELRPVDLSMFIKFQLVSTFRKYLVLNWIYHLWNLSFENYKNFFSFESVL